MQTSKFINSNIKLKGIQHKPKAKKCLPNDIKRAIVRAVHKLSGNLYTDLKEYEVGKYSEIYLIDCLYQNVPAVFPSKFSLQEDGAGILPESSILGTEYLFGNKHSVFGYLGPAETQVIGWHYLKNGAPFYGFFLNDTISLPIIACLYLGEDSLLHTFVPLYGNTINADFLCSIGNEFDTDIYDTVCEIYLKKQLLPKNFSVASYQDSYKVSDRYLMKYGYVDITDVRVSWDAMREDIETTLSVG